MTIDPSLIIESTKAVINTVKGIAALKSDVDKNIAITTILDKLLDLQQNAQLLNDRIQNLQNENGNLIQKIKEYENWADIERQYELREIGEGIFLYSYKSSNNIDGTPHHLLCPKCFKDKKSSILQIKQNSMAGKHYFCPNCKNEYIARHKPPTDSVKQIFNLNF